MWLTANEALLRLKVKPQTLYASVSRGRIRARPDPADPRRSLYNRDDVDRLARRSAGRPRKEAVAADAIRWGDPVLESGVSTIADGRLLYRGQDAATLSATATLEQVAGLLWQWATPPDLGSFGARVVADSPLGSVFAALAPRAARDIPSYGRSPSALRADAASVLATVAHAVCGPGQGAVHNRLAAHWHRPHAADAIRRALVLLADHELNASTFAARVAVSTGAPLAAGTLAGLAALTGPLHGNASAALQSLARRAGENGAEPAIRERIAEGRPIPAFGHQLYPLGDVRATALLAAIALPPIYFDLARIGEALLGEAPNVDFALTALAAAHDLPDEAPIQIFAIARSVGWLAHMLEQAGTGTLIRPRARYTGAKPSVS
jgi:citrate synthase